MYISYDCQSIIFVTKLQYQLKKCVCIIEKEEHHVGAKYVAKCAAFQLDMQSLW